MEIEHDSISSRRYKENWDDAILIMNRQDAVIAASKEEKR